jgi:two-component sensor histidine kinase
MAENSTNNRKKVINFLIQSKKFQTFRDYNNVISSDKEALKYARQVGDTALTLNCWATLATNLADASRESEAIKEFEAIPTFYKNKADKAFWGRYYYGYGALCVNIFSNEKAVSLLNKCIINYDTPESLSKKHRAQSYLAQAYYNIGDVKRAFLILDEMGRDQANGQMSKNAQASYFLTLTNLHFYNQNYEASIAANEQYTAIKREKSQISDIAIADLQKANCLVYLGKFEEAKEVANTAIDAIKKFDIRQGDKSLHLFLSLYNIKRKKYKEAEAQLKSLQKILEKEVIPAELAELQKLKAEMHYSKGDIKKADSCIVAYAILVSKNYDKKTKRALINTIKNNNPKVSASTLELMSFIEDDEGYKKISELYKTKSMEILYSEIINERVNDSDTTLSPYSVVLMDLEKKYQTKLIERKSKITETQLALQEERNRLQERNNTLILAITIGLIFVLVGLVFVLRRLRRDNRTIKELRDEVHHLADNNFELVNQLIESTSDQMNIDLTFLQSRIISIQKLHEILYKIKSIGNVPMYPFFNQITQSIKELYSLSIPVNIKIDTDIILDEKRAKLLARVVGELTTNTFKYAFTGNDNGEIVIKFTQADQQYHLEYSDNGKGFSENASDSFGRKFIKNTVKSSLKGTLEMSGTDGMKAIIVFPT